MTRALFRVRAQMSTWSVTSDTGDGAPRRVPGRTGEHRGGLPPGRVDGRRRRGARRPSHVSTACSSCTTIPGLADGRLIRATPRAELPDSRAVAARGRSMPVPACGSTSRSRTTRASPTSMPPRRWPTRPSPSSVSAASDERWLISSFRMETIDRCRQLAPTIPTAWLTVAVPADVTDVLTARGHVALHPWVGIGDRGGHRAVSCRRPPREHAGPATTPTGCASSSSPGSTASVRTSLTCALRDRWLVLDSIGGRRCASRRLMDRDWPPLRFGRSRSAARRCASCARSDWPPLRFGGRLVARPRRADQEVGARGGTTSRTASGTWRNSSRFVSPR